QARPSDAGQNARGLSASSLCAPGGMAVAGTVLLIADQCNHRVVGFDASQPPATFAPATWFVGQPDGITNGLNQASLVSGSTLAGPRALARAGDVLYIADTEHNRVLVTAAPPVAGAAPLLVYGQA